MSRVSPQSDILIKEGALESRHAQSLIGYIVGRSTRRANQRHRRVGLNEINSEFYGSGSDHVI